jgi:hypothetical protein
MAAFRFLRLGVVAPPEEDDGRDELEHVLAAVQVHRRRRNHRRKPVPFILRGNIVCLYVSLESRVWVLLQHSDASRVGLATQ